MKEWQQRTQIVALSYLSMRSGRRRYPFRAQMLFGGYTIMNGGDQQEESNGLGSKGQSGLPRGRDIVFRELLLRSEVHNSLQDHGNRRRTRHPGSCPLALVPQWGNPSWNPLNPCIKHTRSTSQGTGVFLPLHSKTTTNQGPISGVCLVLTGFPDGSRLSLPDDLNS